MELKGPVLDYARSDFPNTSILNAVATAILVTSAITLPALLPGEVQWDLSLSLVIVHQIPAMVLLARAYFSRHRELIYRRPAWLSVLRIYGALAGPTAIALFLCGHMFALSVGEREPELSTGVLVIIISAAVVIWAVISIVVVAFLLHWAVGFEKSSAWRFSALAAIVFAPMVCLEWIMI
jgi:hypothetical protein